MTRTARVFAVFGFASTHDALDAETLGEDVRISSVRTRIDPAMPDDRAIAQAFAAQKRVRRILTSRHVDGNLVEPVTVLGPLDSYPMRVQPKHTRGLVPLARNDYASGCRWRRVMPT